MEVSTLGIVSVSGHTNQRQKQSCRLRHRCLAGWLFESLIDDDRTDLVLGVKNQASHRLVLSRQGYEN